MARIKSILVAGLSGMLLLAPAPALAEEDKGEQDMLLGEFPSPRALEAYRNFWQSFDQYESSVISRGKSRYNSAWEYLKRDSAVKQNLHRENQLEYLRRAASRYQQHLEEHEGAGNSPHVYLNLAWVLNQIGSIEKATDGGGAAIKEEAIGVLTEMARKFPEFSRKDKSLYLKAIVLADLGQTQRAMGVWKKLATATTGTIYVVHANTAVGDFYFNKEENKKALQYYKRALQLVPGIPEKSRIDYEKIRVQYRVAWAAYRVANLQLAINTGINLLTPGRQGRKLKKQQKIEKDAVELIGDALFENGDIFYTRQTLKRKILLRFAPAIGLRILRNYLDAKVQDDLLDLAGFLTRKFPTAREAPLILSIQAKVLDESGRKEQAVYVSEKLALFLPAQSLWRARHGSNFQAMQEMEELARGAAVRAAAWYYERGMATGNVSAFRSSASWFDILINDRPNGPEAMDWRLKRAHSYYFSGKLKVADHLYSTLKKDFKVGTPTLKIAAYQHVLTREKRWRKAYSKLVAKGQNPGKDPGVIEKLRHLEASIEDFANRFPPSHKDGEIDRSVDLLLVGAAANRDLEKFANATRYWERVLVSNPTPGQRAIAIRGIVLAKIRGGNHAEVITAVKHYLRLEDWKKLGISLGNELRGILSKATIRYGGQLNDEGKVRQAGEMMTETAREFRRLPDFDLIFRDGAYLLAIGGAWTEARMAAAEYLDGGYTRKRADMTYLLARSLEYQIRFANSAHAYLEMGTLYPKHSRAPASLKRAEKLAAAEGDFDTAAKAATLIGKRAKQRRKRLAAYSRAARYYQKGNDHQNALKMARLRRKASKSGVEKMESDLLVARSLYATEQIDKAMAMWKKLATRSRKFRERMDEASFGEISGESHFRLAEEDRARFEDFGILEREGGVLNNVNQKFAFFNDMSRNYEKAIAAKHKDWTPRARFMVAEGADRLADELAGIPGKVDTPLPDKTRERLESMVVRLRKIARKHHGRNLIARSKDPAKYKGNTWIRKSSIKMNNVQNPDAPRRFEDELPPAVGLDRKSVV